MRRRSVRTKLAECENDILISRKLIRDLKDRIDDLETTTAIRVAAESITSKKDYIQNHFPADISEVNPRLHTSLLLAAYMETVTSIDLSPTGVFFELDTIRAAFEHTPSDTD